jgi:hypothetical protein
LDISNLSKIRIFKNKYFKKMHALWGSLVYVGENKNEQYFSPYISIF